ncbi:hypothetical protein FRX31_030190 [Thalictrum thalictroides]|uniref:Uncharacterized protein n=1 Tax=Thalictrum thalictroides TaxID=46969 RepID=A0A7J6V7R3_THATH|nr:hypothetical protein FRX31_030190 [Thalictrum thalictroides]
MAECHGILESIECALSRAGNNYMSSWTQKLQSLLSVITKCHIWRLRQRWKRIKCQIARLKMDSVWRESNFTCCLHMLLAEGRGWYCQSSMCHFQTYTK